METDQIRETLESANSAALVVGEEYSEEKFLLREALASFLRGRNLSVFFLPETPKEIKNKWSVFLSGEDNFLPQKQTSIKIPKKFFTAKELEYEDNEEFLNINLTPTPGAFGTLEKNHILVEQKSMEVDIALCFCQPDIKELIKHSGLAVKKEVIFIIQDEKTISEKIYELMEKIGHNTDPKETNIPHLLLASLLLETDNFRKKITEGVLSLGHTLLSWGADKKIIEDANKNEFSLSYGQILGRALARTRINKELKSTWTFLSHEDVSKAGLQELDVDTITKISRETSRISPQQSVSVILWQNKNSVFAMVIKNQKEKERKIFGPYKNFSEAELFIQQNLKELSL